MTILLDADGSPVRKFVVEIAKKHNIDLIIVSNIHHMIEEPYGEIVTVDDAHDQADHEIVKRTKKGDLVITQDYGLASLILAKGAYAMHQDGWFFTHSNIDHLLMTRHLNQKMRRAGKRTKNMKKRKQETNTIFIQALERFLKDHGSF
jgi:uncharacterized protein YaiI (UPF0178 family)